MVVSDQLSTLKNIRTFTLSISATGTCVTEKLGYCRSVALSNSDIIIIIISTRLFNQFQLVRAHVETRPCWYKSVGCTFEAKTQIVALHEKKCKFQAVYCPSETCSWRESFNGLIGHINDVSRFYDLSSETSVVLS